jgi:hypothetical protein
MRESIFQGNIPKDSQRTEAVSHFYVLIEAGTDKNSLAGMIFVSSVYSKGGLFAGSQEAFQCFCCNGLFPGVQHKLTEWCQFKVKVFYTLLATSIIQVSEIR